MRFSPSRIGCWWIHQPFYLFIFTSLHQFLPWPLSLSFHPLATHFEINFFFFPAWVQLMLFSFSWEQSLHWHAANLSGDTSAYNRYQMPIVAWLVVWFCCHLPTSMLGFLSDWKLFRTFACRHNNCEFVCHCLPVSGKQLPRCQQLPRALTVSTPPPPHRSLSLEGRDVMWMFHLGLSTPRSFIIVLCDEPNLIEILGR